MAEAFQQTAQCGGLAENKKTSQAGGLLVCGDDADKGEIWVRQVAARKGERPGLARQKE